MSTNHITLHRSLGQEEAKGRFREEVKNLLTVLKNDLLESLSYEAASVGRKGFEQFVQKTTVKGWVNKKLEKRLVDPVVDC